MTRALSGTRARTSADVPIATIRSPSTATAPSKNTSCSSFSVTTTASSINNIGRAPRSGRDDHAFQHVLERHVRLVQDLALVDRREPLVAVHDVPVDDRGVHRTAVGREYEVRVQVRLGV